MDQKGQILKGALEMFLKFGIKSITMDDISRTLGVSKKTIYIYFKDKDILVNEAVHVFTEHQKIVLTTMSAEAKNSIEELIKMSDYMRQNVCNINPALLYDIKKYHSQAWAIFINYKRSFVEKSIENTLKRGIEEGYFRNTINSKILARLRMETVEMGFNEDIFPANEFQTSTVQLEFFEQFVFGICTIKGHKLLNKYKQIHEED